MKEIYNQYQSGDSADSRSIIQEDNTDLISSDDDFKLSVYSRFAELPKYNKYLDVLDEVLNQYGQLKANDLIKITHRSGGAWDLTSINGYKLNRVIDPQLVMKGESDNKSMK
ncbi:putative phage-associated protein [Alkalibacillus flavidus]|uniref:Phage-associated protein n=1 Tax=Alkalibacillus flavidus TaxID=546021 RepID=A0ABV2KT56_9BACI